VQFVTKIAVVLRDDLAVWQKTNVTAFLVSGIAGTVEGVVGEPYRDASGNEYLPMFVQPVLVFEADGRGAASGVRARAQPRRDARGVHAGAVRDESRRGESRGGRRRTGRQARPRRHRTPRRAEGGRQGGRPLRFHP
jgi:hypothetical protein